MPNFSALLQSIPNQNPKTPPNRFDSRRNSLLKMENLEMRDKFLKAYNLRKIRIPTETNF